MGIITTSIRIDSDVKDYAKIAAKREGFTFMAFYEDLILRFIKDKHPDLYMEYIKGRPAEKEYVKIVKRSDLAKAIDSGVQIVDKAGVVIIPAKTKELI